MNDAHRPQARDFSQQFGLDEPVELDFVLGYVCDEDSKFEDFKIVFVLESAVRNDKDIELALDASHECVIFQLLPAKVLHGTDLMAAEELHDP